MLREITAGLFVDGLRFPRHPSVCLNRFLISPMLTYVRRLLFSAVFVCFEFLF